MIAVHISWVYLTVPIRGNYLDMSFLFIKHGLGANYMPGTARYKADRGGVRIGALPLVGGSHPAWFCSQGTYGNVWRHF